MQCDTCLNRAEIALQKVPGVDDAPLDFERKIAIVKFNPTKTNTKMLVKTTAKAGFPPSIRHEPVYCLPCPF